MQIATQQCNTIRHASVSAACKIMVATLSTLAKLRYKAALSPIQLPELRGIDKIFSTLYKNVTNNMESFPTALIYLAKRFGGLGLMRFSDEVQIDKLSKIQTSLRSHSLHEAATQGLLNRATRKSGQLSIPGQRVMLNPNGTHSSRKKPLFTDSIVQWLDHYNLRLCRHGARPTLETLICPVKSIGNNFRILGCFSGKSGVTLPILL